MGSSTSKQSTRLPSQKEIAIKKKDDTNTDRIQDKLPGVNSDTSSANYREVIIEESNTKDSPVERADEFTFWGKKEL